MKKISIVVLLICLIQAIGVKTVYKACPAKSDGTFMNCHKAEQAIFMIALVMILAAVLVLVAKRRQTKAILSVVIAVLAVFSVLVPGKVIPLCMMTDMRCISIMKPTATVISIVIAICALLVAFANIKQNETKQITD